MDIEEELEESIDRSFPLITDLQHSVIKLMIHDHEFGRQCIYYLKPHYFSNDKLGWFVKFIQKYFKLYDRMPTETVIKNEITKFDEEDRVVRDILFEKIISADITESAYIQDELTKFVHNAIYKRQFESARKSFNHGDIVSADMAIQTLITERDKVEFKRDKTFDFASSWELFKRLEESLRDRIPLGIPPLDHALIGGVSKKRLIMWLGGTNVGKSVILVNCLVNFVKDNRKVLYIDLENDADEVITRIHSCFTGIVYNRFFRAQNRFDPKEITLVEEAQKILKERAVIKFTHEYNYTIEDLVAYVERKKLEFDFDVLIIDYAQLLKTGHKYDSKYVEHGEIYRMLALLAVRCDIVIMTVAQGNRDAQKKNKTAKRKNSLMTMTDIADSFEAIRKSAIVIAVTRSEKHMADDEIIFLLDKQRQGKTQIAVKFFTKFDCIRVFNNNMKYEIYDENAADELEVYDGVMVE